MSSWTRVLILGTLGQTPVLKKTKNGKAFCRMSLATDRWDQNEKKTSWHSVQVFGRQAEVAAEYLEKGRQVFVEGTLETNTVEFNGAKQWRSWITADRVTFLNGGIRMSQLKKETELSPSDGENSVS